jgi:hypothetical protein
MRVWRIEQRDSRKGYHTHVQGMYKNDWPKWSLTLNPSIEDVCDKFHRGMIVGCESLIELAEWYYPTVYLREDMAKHDLVLACYEVYLREPAGNQCCWYKKHATHIADYDFDAYLEMFDGELNERYGDD